MHFGIRLWSSDQLLEAVFDNYEQLPADVRAELPSSACGPWFRRRAGEALVLKGPFIGLTQRRLPAPPEGDAP